MTRCTTCASIYIYIYVDAHTYICIYIYTYVYIFGQIFFCDAQLRTHWRLYSAIYYLFDI